MGFTNDLLLKALCWGSVACILFSYAGYPFLIAMSAWLRARSAAQTSATGNAIESTHAVYTPAVTVLIAAYNAEHSIASRIGNILASDYPADRLHVVVASDGSTDATVRIVEGLGDSRVQVLAFEKRRGKTATLLEAASMLEGALILFTDATTRFDSTALRRLMRHFYQPEIGLVTGHIAIVNEAGEAVESLYWRSEMAVRRAEARLGIMLGASGAIYAIRRQFIVAPAGPVINDDLVLPTLAHLRHQFQFVLDETAVASVTCIPSFRNEFRRRSRIGTGAPQAIYALREIWRWGNAKQAAAFFAHKLLRWFCPVCLIMLLLSNIALYRQAGYGLLLALQAAAYTLAVAGLFLRGQGFVPRLARLTTSFVVMNLALLMGLLRWARDPRNVLWEPTLRPSCGGTAQRGKSMAAGRSDKQAA